MKNLVHFIRIIAVLLLATSFVYSCAGTPRRDAGKYGEDGEVNKVVFIGMDGHIYTFDPRSEEKVRITSGEMTGEGEEREYRLPTWSPDSSRIAFASYVKKTDGSFEYGVFIVDSDGSNMTNPYTSRYNVPFYLYWGPQGDRIGFLSLSTSGRGNDLQVVRTEGGEAVSLGTGNPSYWTWSPNGRAMVVHSGGAAAQQPGQAKIDFIEAKDMDFSVESIRHRPAFFSAPEYSADGRHFVASIEILQGRNNLALFNSSGALTEVLAHIEGITAFDWSPRGNRLAYIDGGTTPIGGIVGPLNILDMSIGSTQVDMNLDESRAMAFYWSPDGGKIVYYEPVIDREQTEEPRFFFQVSVLDVNSGESTPRVEMIPTQHFLTRVLPYFDQYQRSSTIWSPDSENFLVTAVTESSLPGVYIVTAEGENEPRFVDYGIFPSWSWR